MEAKKISFGFSKITKKLNILPSNVPKEENKVELIKCLEGKEIKLVSEKQETVPLVIQMPTNQKTSTAIASLMKRRAVLLGEEEPEPEESICEPQSIAEVTDKNQDNLEQRAARELLAAAQANGSECVDDENLVLPALKADELPLEGAKEATIDDYESIPIQQFGLAMLRGMGWVDPPVSKKKGTALVDEAPFVRPKGMGLGADKALKPNALLVQPEQNEVLEIKKQAFVRILGGMQKDQYGQIEGFDDHAGRVIVKMAIGGAKETLNEFLCQPISRKEYTQYGKCINTAKYEKFKKQENEHGQIIIKKEVQTDRSREKTERKDGDYEESHRGKQHEEQIDNQRDEGRKSYSTKSEDKKLYKTEHRSTNPEERKSEFKQEDRKLNQRNDRYEERRPSSRDFREERSTYRQEEGRSYKTEERRRDSSVQESNRSSRHQESRRSRSISKSSSRRRQKSSSDEVDDSGESTESDSDSAYERKSKKKSKSSSKSKKKKSKKSKSKSHRHRRSPSNSDEEGDSATDQRPRSSKHKKKTKKSKHARSRTRSRSRDRRDR